MRYFVSFYLQNPNVFDPEVVLNQLRYSGMLETVKIRRAGFPVRRTFKDFFSRLASLICKYFNHGSSCSFVVLNVFLLLIRYKIIMKDRVPAVAADDKKKSTDLLIKYDKTKKEWQLGKTKVGISVLIWDHKTLHKG